MKFLENNSNDAAASGGKYKQNLERVEQNEMTTNKDDMHDKTAGSCCDPRLNVCSPKTTHDSTSPTPGIPSPVCRAMHSVELLTFVSADDECSETAAERHSACCHPSDVGQVLSNTPRHAGSRQPSFLHLNAVSSNLFQAMLLQTSGPRELEHSRDYQASSPVDTGLAPQGRQETSDRVSHDALLAEVRLRHVGARRQRAYKLESEF
jgi:hypothetical protein